MDPAAVARLDASLAAGARWGGNRYLRRPDERGARAYEHYASARDEGWQPRLDFSSPGTSEVLEAVYRGDFGDEARWTE